MLRAIVFLPGTGRVLVPAPRLWATGGLGAGATRATPGQSGFWPAAALAAASEALAPAVTSCEKRF